MKYGISVIIVFAILLSSGEALGNGGPVDLSNTLGTGNCVFSSYYGAELVREMLHITPGMNFVEVEAVYELSDKGEGSETEYAFPVDIAPCMDGYYQYGIDLEQEVRDFSISLDGRELEHSVRQAYENGVYLDRYGDERLYHRLYYVTTISLDPGETVELAVSYRFRASYQDWESTKAFYPSYENRYFRYLLDPAGYWDDGIVESLEICLDFQEVLAMGGSVDLIPWDGRWEGGVYTVTLSDCDLSRIEPIEVSYDVDSWLRSLFLEDMRCDADRMDITASSQLEGYGTENLFHGDLTTAWAEGEDGYDAALGITFSDDFSIGLLGFAAGYQKNGDVYLGNGRPGEVTVEGWRNGDRVLSETVSFADAPWNDLEGLCAPLRIQSVIDNGFGIEVDSMHVSFSNAYPGSTWDDLCISELYICGWSW